MCNHKRAESPISTWGRPYIGDRKEQTLHSAQTVLQRSLCCALRKGCDPPHLRGGGDRALQLMCNFPPVAVSDWPNRGFRCAIEDRARMNHPIRACRIAKHRDVGSVQRVYVAMQRVNVALHWAVVAIPRDDVAMQWVDAGMQ